MLFLYIWTATMSLLAKTNCLLMYQQCQVNWAAIILDVIIAFFFSQTVAFHLAYITNMLVNNIHDLFCFQVAPLFIKAPRLVSRTYLISHNTSVVKVKGSLSACWENMTCCYLQKIHVFKLCVAIRKLSRVLLASDSLSNSFFFCISQSSVSYHIIRWVTLNHCIANFHQRPRPIVPCFSFYEPLYVHCVCAQPLPWNRSKDHLSAKLLYYTSS